MRNIIFLLLATISFSLSSFGQSVSATYSTADIPTGDGAYDATCNGPLTTLVVNIPAGANVTSVEVSYDITAPLAGGGYMSEQRSQIYCQETLLDEGGYSNGTGATGGTFSYNRPGLTLANGISATGVLTFEMRAYRTWTGTAGCNTTVNKVDNNTWTITVNYTNPIPMVYVSSTTSQTNTSDVPVCSANQEIIGVEVEMDGGLSPIDITQLQINMTGTTSLTDVSNIDIFYTGTNSSYSSTNLFASASPVAGTITINGTQTLSAGINYFWIAYDLTATPTIGNVLDAQCTQITIDGSNYAPTVNNPVGSRTLGPCIPYPGGVGTNLTAWFDAKNGVSTSTGGAPIDSWLNNSGNVAVPSITQTNAAQKPIFRTNEINYNPIVEFDGGDDYLYQAATLGSDLFDPSGNTIFMMHRNISGIVYFKWEHTTNNTDRIGFERAGNNVRFDFPTSNGGDQTTGSVAFKTTGEIVTAHTNNNTSSLRMDGTLDATNTTTGTMGTNLTREFIIGNNPTSNPLPCKIDYAELIIYNRALSLAEMNKVESYMAIKYGVTLGTNGTSLNYNSSGGNVIWNAATNNGYSWDIAGVGNDIGTALDQRKSITINEISPGNARDILIGANGTNFTAPNPITSDQSYFVWGHNNAATNLNSVATFSTVNGDDIDAVLDRHWKSQETGTVGTVTLHFDMNAVTGITNWSDLRLLVDADGNFTTGAYSFSPSLIDSTGTLTLEFEHDFTGTEGYFFTLAVTNPSLDLAITNPLPVAVCDSFTLLPITGSNLNNPNYYSETNGPNGIGIVIPVGTVITSDTIIYLYDELGASFDEDTLQITINITPTVTATTNQTSICLGDSVTINGGGATSYSWSSGMVDGVTFMPINTFTDTVTGTTNGCSDTATITITVNSVSIDLGPDIDTCFGNNITIDATTTGATYSWQDASTNPTFNALDSGLYWVDVTLNGCTATDSINITYSSNFTINDSIVNLNCFNDNNGEIHLYGDTAVIVLYPEADSYTDKFSTATNYGADTSLLVNPDWPTSGGAEENYTYLRYDLSTVPTGAILVGTDLEMTAFRGWANGGNGNCYTQFVNDDTWQENTINYNNQPASTGTNIGFWWLWYNSTPGISVGTNSDPALNTQVATEFAGDQKVSLRLHSIGYETEYFSKESTNQSQHPKLIIKYLIPYTYSWTGPNGFTSNANPITGLEDSTYNVTITNPEGCSLDTFYTVTEPPILTLDLDSIDAACGNNNGEISTTVTGGVSPYSYSWSANATALDTNFVDNLGVGTYVLTITDSNGCTITDSSHINQAAAHTVNLGLDIDTCSGNSILLDATAAGATYVWQDASSNSTFTPITTGTYWVDVIINGCTASDTIDITIYPLPNVTAISTNTTICNGDPVTLTGNGANTYSWTNGVIDGTSFSPSSTLTYTVTGTDVNNCDNTDQITVTVNPLPSITLGPDTFICKETITLTPGTGYSTYLWQDGSTNNNFSTSSIGVYSVNITNAQGCPASAQIEVFEECPFNLWIPNVFTPNEDGKNDLFIIQSEAIVDFQLSIFNRWGQLLFESNDIDISWDGRTSSGNIAPEGTYVYLVNYSYKVKRNLLHDTKHGSVTLLK